MKYFIFFTLFLTSYCKIKEKEEESVRVLTSQNWNEAVPKDGNVLVEFYSDTCSHCKTLAPEYAKAAETLKTTNPDITLAKVDGNVERKLMQKYNVKAYPTIIFFRKGEQLDYAGGRTESDIISWLNKKMGAPATDLESAKNVESFVADRDVAVLGFFASKESELAKAFITVADTLDDVVFGIAHPSASGKYDIRKDKIILVKKFDNLRVDYEGKANTTHLESFINKESVRLVTEYTSKNAHSLFGYDLKPYYLLFVSKSADDFNTILEAFTSTSKSMRDKATFIYINTDVEDENNILQMCGVSKEDIPTKRLITLIEDFSKYFPEDDDVTEKSFLEFLQTFFDGKLKGVVGTTQEENDEKNIQKGAKDNLHGGEL